MTDVILFVPGFFGFGAFGHPDRPLIEYFARVEDALVRSGGTQPLHFAVHQPPPAGSLQERAQSLHDKAAQLVQQGAQRLHVVGHSTGALDARLLANPAYGGLAPRAELIAKIASVVTLSAPFHGTPLARRVGRATWLAMPGLWFASILASRGRLRIAGQLGALFNFGKRLVQQKTTPTDDLIAELADVDDETAHQIKRFLGDVARDHRLVDDLTPESMGELNRGLAGHDAAPIRSFVSVAPPPRPGLRDAGAFVRAPLQRVFYDTAYLLSATAPVGDARTPQGPWIGPQHVALTHTASDGIVPAWSQTLDGHARGIVLGDHLDVIGHYESGNATFLSSGSRFDDTRFRALWRAVGHAIRR